MQATSQVILRSTAVLPAGPVLLIDPPADQLPEFLRSTGRVIGASTPSRGVFRSLSRLGTGVAYEAIPRVDPSVSTVIMSLPREKDRLTMMLHACASAMPANARLWLVGEKRAGIKSASPYLRRFFEQVNALDSARHCSLIEARRPGAAEPFRLDDYEHRWSVSYAGRDIRLASLPGVFAHGRLDPGTAVLLETMRPLRPEGRLLDFASGSGVIGLAAAAASENVQLTLLDDSALAIESGRRSLALNGFEARCLPSDGLSELAGRYDWIISNPPFHRGVKNDLEIARAFFAQAGTFLDEKGKILVVFNQHLPYVGWMRKFFRTIEPLAQRGGFNVTLVSDPL